MEIQDIMSKPPVTCTADDSLHLAAQLMWEHDCGAIPVTGEDGRLIGIITDRDVCMATYTKAQAPQAIRVAEAMAKQVFSVQADEELDTVEHLMSDKQVRRVPVVDAANRPVGIVSLNDLAHHAVVGREKKGLERAVTQTLAAICRPRTSASSSAAQRRPTARRASA